MASGIVISDTSTLIALAWLDRLDLFSHLFGQVHIPVAVQGELTRNLKLFGIVALDISALLVVTPVRDQISVKLLQDQLDIGESEAIVLVHELQADLLLMDERRGRRRASQSGLAVLGTLGILLRAKQLGLVEQVRPLLDQLRLLPFHVSEELYTDVLHRAGE